MIKKILLVITSTILIFTLSSCRRQNLHTPLQGIGENTVFASANGIDVTELELYNRLRAQHGQTIITEQIHEFLLQEYITTVNTAVNAVTSASRSVPEEQQEIYDDLVDIILNAIFNTNDLENIATMDSSNKNQTIERFIDNFFTTNGVVLTGDLVTFKTTHGGTVIEKVTSVNEILLDHYAIQVARNLFGKEILRAEYNVEYLDEDEEEANPNFVSEEDIENQFENMHDFGTRYAIIITFPTRRVATTLMQEVASDLGISLTSNGALPSTMSEEEVLRFFTQLYYKRYAQAKNISGATIDDILEQIKENEDFTFVNDADGNELISAGSGFNSLFSDFEDKEFTNRPVVIGGTESMFLRVAEDLRFGEDPEWTEEFFEGLEGESMDEVRDEIISLILDRALSSSFINNRLNRLIDSDDVKLTIFDPIIEFLFARNREDFEFNNVRQDELVMSITYGGRTKDLKVREFFEILVNRFAVEHVTEILLNRMLAGTEAFTSQLSDEALDNFATAFGEISRTFRASDFRPLGFENYLLINHGYDNREDVINYSLKSSSLLDIAMNDFSTIEGEFADNNGRFIEEGTIFSFFAHFTQQAFHDQFSIGMEHILITIDYDNDGNPDDPLMYYQWLIGENRLSDADNFYETIQEIAYWILREVDVMNQSGSTMNRLQAIADSFRAGGIIHSSRVNATSEDDFIYWSDFWRNYNIGLTVESLGTVTASSVNNFVTPFANRVRQLHSFLTSPEGEALLDENTGFFEGNRILENINDNFEDIGLFTQVDGTSLDNSLTHTVFGFHILNVTTITEPNSARFTRDNDWSLTPGGDLRLENIEVILNPLEDEEYHEIVISDAYSGDFDHPSSSQLFVWFFESQRSGGATSGNTSIRNVISSLLNPVTSKFRDSNFQTWRLIQFFDLFEELEFGFEFNDDDALSLEERFNKTNNEILRRTFFDYKDQTDENLEFRGWFETYTSFFLTRSN